MIKSVDPVDALIISLGMFFVGLYLGTMISVFRDEKRSTIEIEIPRKHSNKIAINKNSLRKPKVQKRG
jgi:hypothetical protein